MKNKTTQSGFTLIELMIVVAIVGILTSIALPSYQIYIARARVSEVLGLMSSAKVSVEEYRLSRGDWPSNNTQAGLVTPSSISGVSVSSITVNGSLISATVRSSMIPDGGVVNFLGSFEAAGSSVRWSCNAAAGTTVKNIYLPAECR